MTVEKKSWEFTVAYTENVPDGSTPRGFREVTFAQVHKFDDPTAARRQLHWHLTHDDWMPQAAHTPDVSELYERTIFVGDKGEGSSSGLRFADPQRSDRDAARAGVTAIRRTLSEIKNPGPLFGRLSSAAKVPRTRTKEPCSSYSGSGRDCSVCNWPHPDHRKAS